MYYAIQDVDIGYIQYVTEASDPDEALVLFLEDIFVAAADLPMEEVVVTELSHCQYELLKFADGTDQDAIDLLEQFKVDRRQMLRIKGFRITSN